MSTKTITVNQAQVRAAQALLADTERYGTPRDGVAQIAALADESISANRTRPAGRISRRAAARGQYSA
jgi:hypothetical protein